MYAEQKRGLQNVSCPHVTVVALSWVYEFIDCHNVKGDNW